MSLFEIENKKAVIVAPHADDEVLSSGGLIARLSEEGWAVHVLYAVVSGFESLDGAKSSTTSEREEELANALAVLNCTSWQILFRGSALHLKLDTVPQSDLIRLVEAELVAQRPSLVVVPSLADHHQDHRAMARACITALRPAPEGQRPLVPLVLAYGQSGAAGWGGAAYEFRPTTFVDIGRVLDKKLKAMGCYSSQVFASPHARSLEGIRARASVFGALGGCEYAEGFECLRHVC